MIFIGINSNIQKENVSWRIPKLSQEQGDHSRGLQGAREDIPKSSKDRFFAYTKRGREREERERRDKGRGNSKC